MFPLIKEHSQTTGREGCYEFGRTIGLYLVKIKVECDKILCYKNRQQIVDMMPQSTC
jgi:hypothetical protein